MTKIQLPLVILRPAPRLALILVLAHAGACMLLLFLPLPIWLTSVLLSGIAASAVYSVWRQALRRGSLAVTHLRFLDRERLEIGRRDGSFQSGRIQGSSTVGSLLTVLNISIDRRRWPAHVVLTPDGIDEDAFRRLRVWLRWGPTGGRRPEE